MSAEEEHAYKVLAEHFGYSVDYIKRVLERHFAPSDAGRGYDGQVTWLPAARERTYAPARITRGEIKAYLDLVDDLRAAGKIPPYEAPFYKQYKWSEKQGRLIEVSPGHEDRISIDCHGNLCANGQVVKRGWLKSFGETFGGSSSEDEE